MSGQSARHKHVGQEVKTRREAIGLSREGLAYKSGVALKTIERVEREETFPRRSTTTVILAALDRAEEDEKAAA